MKTTKTKANGEHEERYEKKLPPHKRLVNYKDGASIYCMGVTKFQEMAKEAKAVYKFNQVVVVDLDIFDAYIEGFRL